MANSFASELSYQVAQKRRREAQLTTPQLHERLGVSYLLVQQRPVVLDAHPADRIVGMSEEMWQMRRMLHRLER